MGFNWTSGDSVFKFWRVRLVGVAVLPKRAPVRKLPLSKVASLAILSRRLVPLALPTSFAFVLVHLWHLAELREESILKSWVLNFISSFQFKFQIVPVTFSRAATSTPNPRHRNPVPMHLPQDRFSTATPPRSFFFDRNRALLFRTQWTPNPAEVHKEGGHDERWQGAVPQGQQPGRHPAGG